MPDESHSLSPYERMRPMLGAVIGLIVLYAAIAGAYLYWQTMSRYLLIIPATAYLLLPERGF